MSNEATVSAIVESLGSRVIAFHAVYAKISGSVTHGLFLSQAMFWQSKRPGEFWWKSYKEWSDETCLSERKIDKARMFWRDAGVLEEMRGASFNRTIHYRVNLHILGSIIAAWHAADSTKRPDGSGPPSPNGSECTIEEYKPDQSKGSARTDDSKMTPKMSTKMTLPPYNGSTGVANVYKNTTDLDQFRDVCPKNVGAPDFDAFWGVCPKKVGKRAARTAYLKAIKTVSGGRIMTGMHRYADWTERNAIEVRYIVHPSTWLNQGRWDDVLRDTPKQKDKHDDKREIREWLLKVAEGHTPPLAIESNGYNDDTGWTDDGNFKTEAVSLR